MIKKNNTVQNLRLPYEQRQLHPTIHGKSTLFVDQRAQKANYPVLCGAFCVSNLRSVLDVPHFGGVRIIA
jgi:hypothetical protein